jgi:hypothetical protein
MAAARGRNPESAGAAAAMIVAQPIGKRYCFPFRLFQMSESRFVRAGIAQCPHNASLRRGLGYTSGLAIDV